MERADVKTRFSSENQPATNGRKTGSRNKLSTDFMEALSADFSAHGAAVIEEARKLNPLGYLNIVAGLQRKEVEILTPESKLTDEQLDQVYEALLAKLPGPQSETPKTVN
jgi:hypothetical protein